MMDVARYVNSKDIRKYLRDIKYNFNAAEAAWLVYQNRGLSFEDRCMAFQEIIDTIKDMEWNNSHTGKKIVSIHSLIKDYIKLQNKLYDIFTKNDGKHIYKYSASFDGSDILQDSSQVFSNYDSLIEFIKKYKPLYETCIYNNKTKENNIKIYNLFEIKIERIELDSDYIKDDEIVYLNNKFEFESVFIADDRILTKEEYDLIYKFREFFFFFPTPFEKGDILYNPYEKYDFAYDFCAKSPFVFEKDCEELFKGKYGSDDSDMVFWGYFVNENASIYYECSGNYMDFEYYREELKENQRSLICISNYLKNNLELEYLVNGYHQILLEQFLKMQDKNLYIINDLGRKDCGLIK